MTRLIPLPRELLDHSLSDADLQDRWVEGATKQLQKLYAQRRTVQHELALIEESITRAEEFLRQAKDAQAKHRQREQKDGPQYPAPRPAQVQALLSRRSPAQVQALLEGMTEQAMEIADEKPGRLPRTKQSERITDAQWHPDQPKLPKPK